jgi:hypothetical protein
VREPSPFFFFFFFLPSPTAGGACAHRGLGQRGGGERRRRLGCLGSLTRRLDPRRRLGRRRLCRRGLRRRRLRRQDRAGRLGRRGRRRHRLGDRGRRLDLCGRLPLALGLSGERRGPDRSPRPRPREAARRWASASPSANASSGGDDGELSSVSPAARGDRSDRGRNRRPLFDRNRFDMRPESLRYTTNAEPWVAGPRYSHFGPLAEAKDRGVGRVAYQSPTGRRLIVGIVAPAAPAARARGAPDPGTEIACFAPVCADDHGRAGGDRPSSFSTC